METLSRCLRYHLGLLLLLLSLAPAVAQAPSARECCRPTPQAGLARQAYLEGVLALSDQDYQLAVTKLEQAVQLAPTNAVYARLLAVARQKLRDLPR
jgi:Flp pilus assembly protein TadD